MKIYGYDKIETIITTEFQEDLLEDGQCPLCGEKNIKRLEILKLDSKQCQHCYRIYIIQSLA